MVKCIVANSFDVSFTKSEQEDEKKSKEGNMENIMHQQKELKKRVVAILLSTSIVIVCFVAFNKICQNLTTFH
jgi:hypothetical protein